MFKFNLIIWEELSTFRFIFTILPSLLMYSLSMFDAFNDFNQMYCALFCYTLQFLENGTINLMYKMYSLSMFNSWLNDLNKFCNAVYIFLYYMFVMTSWKRNNTLDMRCRWQFSRLKLKVIFMINLLKQL